MIMSGYYFVHPLRDNDRDLSTYNYTTYPGHDGDGGKNKVDINSDGTQYSTARNKIVSMIDGTIVGCGTYDTGDGYVKIEANENNGESVCEPIKSMRYIHVLVDDELSSKEGTTVKRGDFIGYVASPTDNGYGTATGPHLHVDFSINKNLDKIMEPFSRDNLDGYLGPDSDDYNYDIYSKLCSEAGIGVDENTYILPYAIWARKPQTGSTTSIENGTEVDCSSISGQAPIDVGYYTEYDIMEWAEGTAQYQVYEKWRNEDNNPKWKDDLAILNNRYLVAVATSDYGTNFGYVGDMIDIVLTNGEVINAIIADAKNITGDSTGAQWGHQSYTGLNIVEFEIKGGTGDDISTPDNWRGQTITKIIVGNSVL